MPNNVPFFQQDDTAHFGLRIGGVWFRRPSARREFSRR